MNVQPVTDLDDPRISDYRNVSDPELMRTRGVFVAEGRLVVRMLLTRARYPARSLLVTQAALDDLRALLETLRRPLPVFLATQACVNHIVGFNIHRGCMALGERPEPVPVAELLPAGSSEHIVVALEGIGNADNMGGIFRNALAFGADGVLLSPSSCDPLYRKAIRTSIGASLRLRFATVGDWPAGLHQLRDHGLTIAALTPDRTATSLAEFVAAGVPRRMALLVGTEGEGLTDDAVSTADVRIRIPMVRQVDSLNVATALGIALHRVHDARAVPTGDGRAE